jgi:tRNA(adenine34) deaminase
VGCVVLYDGRLIVAGAREGTAAGGTNETDHAEMVALRQLERVDPSLDRSRMTLYCTMEPCLMCFGAIILSGIKTVVYAFEDPMGGGTACDLSSLPMLYRNCRIRIKKGVCRGKSLDLFYDFFNKKGNLYWKDSFLEQYVRDQKRSGIK